MAKLLQIVPMICTSRKSERHVDPVLFGVISFEKLGLTGQVQNLIPPPKPAFEALKGDSPTQSWGKTSGAPKIFSLALAGVSTDFAGPMRTKSRRSFWNVFDAPLLHDIGDPDSWSWWGITSKSATMIPSLTGIFCSTPAQASLVATSTQISHTLACEHSLRMLHGPYTGLERRLSAMTTHLETFVIHDSGRKLLCVECELWTKSCTQNKTSRTSRSGTAFPSRLFMNFSPRVKGPLNTKAAIWKTWNITSNKPNFTMAIHLS